MPVNAMEGVESEHTAVTAKVHFIRDRELHTLERISLLDDQRKLLFSVEGKMPNGRAERHDFLFDLAEAVPRLSSAR